MAIPVIFLKFKVELITTTTTDPPVLVNRLGVLAETAALPVNTRIAGASMSDNVIITGNYNAITSQLQSPPFAGTICVVNTRYLRGIYNLDAYTTTLKQYVPGSIVLTVDLETDASGQVPGTTNRYGIMLTEKSTGDYGIYFSQSSSSSWFKADGTLLYTLTNFSGLFVTMRLYNYDNHSIGTSGLVASAINDEGTVQSGSMVLWGADVRPAFTPPRVYSKYVNASSTVAGHLITLINRWRHYLAPGTVDPYDNVPPSSPGGGGGSGDWGGSDNIDFPGNPGMSAVNTGFISLWAPTEQQMLNLSSYMWNADVFTIDFWKKLWADPLDVIYGLNIIPLDLRAPGRDVVGGTDSVIVGLVNTNVQMDYLVEQWITLDCGTLDINEVWGAYLDYDPYTKLEIYLPYCGTHPLHVDDFMSGHISLKYKVDLLSGACVAMIKAVKSNTEDDDLNSVVYQFMGNCATQVPVTASQYADAVRSVISLAASVGTLVATGGASAAAAGGAASAASSSTNIARIAERAIGTGAATAENVMGIKPAIERSGAIGAAAGLLGVQTPYLIITRPRQAHPEEQNRFTGYPAFITETLGDLEGWTIIKEIHLENIPCTADELSEIDSILKSGVIF